MKSRSVPLAIVAVTLALGGLSGAHAVEYSIIDPDASRLAFTYRQMSVNMDGSFSQLQARQFSFDPSAPEAAHVVIEIPLAGIDAGYGEANAELKKSEWLNTAAHPVAKFESSKVEALGANRYAVTGQLSIKGKTREVTAPFTFSVKGSTGIFDGVLSFSRADFAIGEGQWRDAGIVANDIQVKFHVVAGQ